MNSPRQQEMDKLQATERQRAAIQQRLDERLPHQRRQLAVLVTATKWRLTTLHRHSPHTYTQGMVDTTVKKLRMEVGAFEYAVKEQSELLTRALFQLDDILSHGDPAIKDARKSLVLSIQQLLEQADRMNSAAAALKQFTERMMNRLPAVPEATDELMGEALEDTESPMETQTEPESIEQQDDDWEHVGADSGSDGEEDEATQDEATEDPAHTEDAVMQQPDEAVQEYAQQELEDENDDEDANQNDKPTNDDASPSDDADSLPVWRPYYQIQKRPDGVYLKANLRGVDPRHVQIHAMPQHGVLRISGVKYPNHKDLVLSRLSGAPTFGRFEIVERFPTRLLNLENASQHLSPDGTLEVRVPFYFVHHPHVMRRFSPCQPHRLMVW